MIPENKLVVAKRRTVWKCGKIQKKLLAILHKHNGQLDLVSLVSKIEAEEPIILQSLEGLESRGIIVYQEE
jgi:hypothetical protein